MQILSPSFPDIALIKNNAQIGSSIAVELCRMRKLKEKKAAVSCYFVRKCLLVPTMYVHSSLLELWILRLPVFSLQSCFATSQFATSWVVSLHFEVDSHHIFSQFATLLEFEITIKTDFVTTFVDFGVERVDISIQAEANRLLNEEKQLQECSKLSSYNADLDLWRNDRTADRHVPPLQEAKENRDRDLCSCRLQMFSYLWKHSVFRLSFSQLLKQRRRQRERHKTIGLMNKTNRSARALYVFVHFFAILCKTTTWNDQGRFPFNPNFRFGFPATSSSEWNRIFRLTAPVMTIFRYFQKRGQPLEVYPNFRKNFPGSFLSIPTLLPEFLKFSVEWFAFRKFNSFRNFWKLFQEISVPFAESFGWMESAPNLRFCGEREHTTVNFSFSFVPWTPFLSIQFLDTTPTLYKFNE